VFNWSMVRSNRAMESFGAMHKRVWSMVERISTMVESFLAMMERVSWMVRGEAEAIVGQSQVMRCQMVSICCPQGVPQVMALKWVSEHR